MGINQMIVILMTCFMAWAALDKYLLKGRFGYGEKFDEAFSAMGPLSLSIVGIMCFAPVLGKLLTPLFTPLFNLIGADPAILAGSVLASDMGGFSLAGAMTDNPDIKILSGIFLGSTMGVAVIFVIPYTAAVIEKEDQPYLSKGILSGVITIPVGCLISGLISGMPLKMLIINLLPAAFLAVLLALGLWLVPSLVTTLFSWFSKLLTVIIGVLLVAAITEALTEFVVIPGMAPIAAQFEIVGYIAIMLAGAYPFIHFLNTVLSKPLFKLGKLLNINSVAVAGMLASLANTLAMYPMVKDMDKRGKVMTIAFSIGAGFAVGDLLAYTSAQAPEYIFPMIAGKIIAGVLGAVVGSIVTGKEITV